MSTITCQINPTFINHAGEYNLPDGAIPTSIMPSGFENSDFFLLPIKYFNFLSSNVVDQTSTHYKAALQTGTDFFKTAMKATNTVEYFGIGFNYSGSSLVGGAVTRISVNIEGGAAYTISGINLQVSQISAWAWRLDDARVSEYFNSVLPGGDTIVGSSKDDRLAAGSGGDTLVGNGGNDQLSGGAGVDTAIIGLVRNQATVVLGFNGTVTGAGISDTLTSIERLRFIDGTLAYGPDTMEAQAARLYQAAFGRTPDASGLSYWAGLLQGGASLADIAAGFLTSAEFVSRYGNLDNAGFVDALYRNVLGRAADAPGSAYWTGLLTNGSANQTQVLVSFSESAENKTETTALVVAGLWAPDANAASAARLYYATLGRAPDAAGLSFWTTQIETGAATLQQEANGFVTSAEFTSRYGNLSNGNFVNLLYQNVMGRGADQDGLSYWTGQLADGVGSRTGVVLAFSESAELKARLAPIIEQNGIVVA